MPYPKRAVHEILLAPDEECVCHWLQSRVQIPAPPLVPSVGHGLEPELLLLPLQEEAFVSGLSRGIEPAVEHASHIFCSVMFSTIAVNSCARRLTFSLDILVALHETELLHMTNAKAFPFLKGNT